MFYLSREGPNTCWEGVLPFKPHKNQLKSFEHKTFEAFDFFLAFQDH